LDAHSASPARLEPVGARRWRLPPAPRWLAPALAVALGYYLAARLGFLFTLQPHPISILWAPNALLGAALMLAPARTWWWLIAAAFPAHLAAELQSGVPTAMVLGWFISNCSEALLVAGAVRLFVPGPVRLDSLRTVAIFVLAAVVAPLLSSFLDAALVRLVGWSEVAYLDLVAARFWSNVLAELVVATLILGWAAVGLARLREAPGARHLEATIVFTGLLAVCLLVFDLSYYDTHVSPAALYAPLPFLLWAAARLGPAGAASAMAVMTLTTIWGAAHGIGPFTGRSPQDTAREMQLFLIAAAVPLLLLAAALEERLRMEREASEQRRQLTHLSRVAMLSDLSGGIAHELNQPLTAILSNAQAAQAFLANKTADPEMLSEILHDIILADRRAGDVIDRLRALFKRGETSFERLDPNRLVTDVLSLAQGDLATRHIEVVLKLAARPPEVRGDRVQLQQVLLNLIVNAAEAMSSPAPMARVLSISTLATAGGVHFRVVDRGAGFKAAPEVIFQPFYTTKPQGLGLGLSISKSIVIAHGGRLTASNRRTGGGAAFLITLPSLPPKG
jgi:signal transduction histidine kinase